MTPNALMVKPPPAGRQGAAVAAHPQQQARLALRCLNPHAGDSMLTEVRWWRRGGRPIQQWFTNPDAAADYAYSHRDDGDVYVGVVPRVRRGGTRDALADAASVLWVECDDTMATERAMGLRPHMLVQSSLPGKTHAYWLVQEQLTMDQVERANRRLAHHLGGDMRATDAARILRVPGCTHRKGDPMPVLLLEWTGEPNVPAGSLVADLPDPAPPRVRRTVLRPKARSTETEYLSVVPANVYVPALTGRDIDVAGMVQCPFHKGGQERTPSLSTGGPQDTLYYCFGCGEGGDIFRLAARLEGLDEKRQFPAVVAEVKRALR